MTQKVAKHSLPRTKIDKIFFVAFIVVIVVLMHVCDTFAAPATGGTIANDGTYWIHTFTSDGVFTPSKSLVVDSIVVGSGGAGAPDVRGGYGGGGGGGGGVIYTSGDSMTVQAYTVIVGGITISNSVPDGTSNGGENSSFNGHIAIGGGGGGNEGGGVGGNGGSGGGGGGTWEVDAGVSQSDGGSPTPGQGYTGGKGQEGGGGGGGASGVGGDGSGNTGGNGGIGLLSSISGSALYYGGGGGGGSDSVGGSGGNGGGGRGGSYALDFTDGAPNTGGGGGGSGIDGPATAGNGGSGIVIIRYPMNRNNYLVTGGDPASLPIVGASSITLPTITITDVDGDDIANTNPGEQFEISINTTDYGAVEFDQTIAAESLTIAGSCGHTSTSAVTYPTATTARVTVTGAGGASTCAAGATVTIAGLKVKTVHTQSAPSAHNLVTVDNLTTSSGTALATSDTISLSVIAATLTETNVEPATLVAGETGTATVSFTTANPIPNNGIIKVTFGSGFDVSVSTGVTCSSQDGGFVTTIDGQTVILTRNGTGTPEPAGAQTCTIDLIQNPSSAGTTEVYTIATYLNDGVSGLDIDTAVGADMIVPNAPTVSNPTSTTLDVNPITGGAESAMAIYVEQGETCDGTGGLGYVQANGSIADSAVWQTDAEWDTTTVTGLTSNIQYSFCVKARNGDSVETGFGTASSETTASGGGSSSGSDVTTQDTTPPTNVSISVVGAPKVPTPNIQLIISATDASEMIIANMSDFSGGIWESYKTLKDWTLSNGGGGKTIYAKFRDSTGNTTGSYQASVTIDTTALEPEYIGTQETQDIETQETEEVETEKSETQETETQEPGTQTDSNTPDPVTGFTDTNTSWAHDYINELFTMGVISGKDSTTFAPDDSLTRVEIVKIVVLTFGINVIEDSTPTFKDVHQNDWYAKYLASAETVGIIEGYADGTFQPNNTINRAEALKIILTTSGKIIDGAPQSPFTDVPATAWYAKYVNYAYEQGIVSGRTPTTFVPDDNITRGEMAKIAVKALNIN